MTLTKNLGENDDHKTILMPPPLMHSECNRQIKGHSQQQIFSVLNSHLQAKEIHFGQIIPIFRAFQVPGPFITSRMMTLRVAFVDIHREMYDFLCFILKINVLRMKV